MEKCKTLIKYKLMYWLSLGVMFLTMYVFGHILVMMYYPFKTIDVQEPIPVVEKVAKRGGSLTYICIYTKYIDRDATLTMQLYNLDIGHYISLPVDHSNVLPGIGTAFKSIHIPSTVVVGRYKLIITTKYEINVFRTICKRFATEEFDVIQR